MNGGKVELEQDNYGQVIAIVHELCQEAREDGQGVQKTQDDSCPGSVRWGMR